MIVSLLSLLLTPTAKAQGAYPGGGGYPGGSWNVTDQNGNTLTAGPAGYTLVGTPASVHGLYPASSNTYPPPMTGAALFPPPNTLDKYWVQLPSGAPPTYSPNPLTDLALYNLALFLPSNGLSLSARAANNAFVNGTYGSFNAGNYPTYTSQIYQTASDCEQVLGGTDTGTISTMWAYWHWTGTGTAPSYLDLLLTTTVSASASAPEIGLSASGMATDGAPFQETVTAVQNLPSQNIPSPPPVVGHHLLHVPVVGGVAVVSLNGTVGVTAATAIPYGALQPYEGQGSQLGYVATHGPKVFTSNASVSATVNQDNREVTISANIDATNGKSPSLDASEIQTQDAYGNPLFVPKHHVPGADGTMSGDIGLSFGDNDYTAQYNYANVTYTANPTGNWAQNLSQYL